jgi:hypothetical protein
VTVLSLLFAWGKPRVFLDHDRESEPALIPTSVGSDSLGVYGKGEY